MSTDVERQVLTAAEVGEMLGMHPTTVLRMTRTDSFPIKHFEIGRRIKFSKRLVERYLAGETDGQVKAS